MRRRKGRAKMEIGRCLVREGDGKVARERQQE